LYSANSQRHLTHGEIVPLQTLELLAWVTCIAQRILLELSADPGGTAVYTRKRSNIVSFNSTALLQVTLLKSPILCKESAHKV